MNKALVLLATCISLVGCLIVGVCVYRACLFGNGNFNQVIYVTRIDPVTKIIDRDWFELPTTERGASAFINMWMAGAMLLIAGPATIALEFTLRDNHHF